MVFIYLKTDIIRFHYKLINGLIITLNTNLLNVIFRDDQVVAVMLYLDIK